MSGRPNPGRAGAVGVAVLALGLVTVSCGSTVPVPTSAQSAPPGAPAAGGGLSVPTGTTTNGSSAGPSFHGAGGAVGGGTNAGTTGVGGGTSGGGNRGTTPVGGPSGGPTSASAPGITTTTIYLGALYLKNQAAGNAAAGAAGEGGT